MPPDWDAWGDPLIGEFEEESFVFDQPTLCVACDHVHPDSKSKPPFQWRCLKSPAPPLGGFVDPNYRPDPPYHRCEKLNNGQCQHWTPIKKPKEQNDD